jgi:hypothetical protein
LVLPIIAYTLTSTKLEIRAKQFLPDSEGVGREVGGGSVKEGGGVEGERTQKLYAHMNKKFK